MMIAYKPEELERIDETIKRNDIRFIRLQFSDIIGSSKQITFPVDYWEDAVAHGVWFDGSAVEGFARVAESDMYLKPDLDTFIVIPWEMDLSTARVICDVHTLTERLSKATRARCSSANWRARRRLGWTTTSARSWSSSCSRCMATASCCR
jgi:glutamine synthetase